MDNIHFIDVVHQLMAGNILSCEEWLWQKQLRYYMGPNKQAIMRMVDAEFAYTYEYQGKLWYINFDDISFDYYQ